MNSQILYKFFEGTATEDEEKELRLWIEESAENKKRFMEERKLFDAVLLLSDDSSSIKTEKPKKLQKRIFFRELLKVASVALIVLTACWLYMETKENKLASSMQIVSVPAGQRANLILPDGTNIWLNAQTTIEYPVLFNDNERIVKLDGQAYFEVTHNNDAPFIVETAKGRIQVLGTKFDVMAYSNSPDFETALMEGEVKVSLSSTPSQPITLSPNNKAYLNNGKLFIEPVEDYNLYRWREGLICFNNEPFIDIMKDFERYFGIQIIVENTQISERSYTGKFRFSDGLDYALRVLQEDHNFSYERNKDRNIIYVR